MRIANCPAIAENRVLAALVRQLGGTAELAGDILELDPAGIHTSEPDPSLVARIHGAVYLVPALLARSGAVSMPGSGGCQIGDSADGQRPVDQYADVLRRFGATVVAGPDGGLSVRAGALTGCEIDLLDYTSIRSAKTGPRYSGATKMALLTATVARGTSVLGNPYPKPDVTDMVTVLRRIGARIDQPRKDLLVVHGDPDRLRSCADTTLLPDLIEVVTWACVGASLCPYGLVVTGQDMPRAVAALAPELAVLEAMGIPIETSSSALAVRPPPAGLAPVDVLITSHGVFSDSQPFLTLLACAATGTSRLRETVWRRRFDYAGQLNRLGTRLRADGDTLTVAGPCPPIRPDRHLVATDLRAAAVLLLAALQVDGSTLIDGTAHLARGYADLPGRLIELGADIEQR